MASLGFYHIATGLTINTDYVKLQGVGASRSIIYTDQASVSILTLSAQRSSVSDMTLWNTVPTTADTLALLDGCGQSVFRDIVLAGGRYCLSAIGTGFIVDNIFENVVAQQALGGSTVYIKGAGTQFFKRCLFNQTWPNGVPAKTSDKGTRANSTAYSAHDFAIYNGYYLQCMTAGTSESSGPSFTGAYYGINLVDGGVTWRIAGNATGFAVTIETGSTYITFDDCDTTGPYNYSVAVQNSFSGNAPDQIDFTRCTSAGTTAGCFFIGAGRRITLEKNECEAVIGAGTTIAYFIGSSVTGDVTLHNNSAVTNFNYGIYLAHAGTALVTNNKIFGCVTGIYVAANVNHNQIIGNDVGSSNVWGANTVSIQLAVGTSDYYWTLANRIFGSGAINNGATGSHFYVAGNM